MDVDRSPIGIDEFLDSPAPHTPYLATVARVEGNADVVLVTPMSQASGCQCGSEFEIAKTEIASVTPTGNSHHCCGKQVQIVELAFADGASVSVSSLFEKAQTAHQHAEYAPSQTGMTGLAGGQVHYVPGTATLAPQGQVNAGKTCTYYYKCIGSSQMLCRGCCDASGNCEEYCSGGHGSCSSGSGSYPLPGQPTAPQWPFGPTPYPPLQYYGSQYRAAAYPSAYMGLAQ